MTQRTNKDIRDNYQKYLNFLQGYKECPDRLIYLSGIKGNHQTTRQTIVSVLHEESKVEIKLILESSIKDKRSYKFKLRAEVLTSEPYFRFDSDGPSHFNRSLDVPLAEQKIDTPHFNAFDQNGKSIAYHTETLNIEQEKKAILDDISLGMAHFCDEANLYCNTEHVEVSQFVSGELGIELDNLTPLDGIEYD